MKIRGCGNSWEKGLREQVIPSEKKRLSEILGKKRMRELGVPFVKKRLWEILGQERLQEQGFLCERRGCGKFLGK